MGAPDDDGGTRVIERCVCEPATSPSDDLTFTAWLDDSVALGEHQDVQAGVFAIRGYCNPHVA
jgi:hypothetical protein